jgi:hypothetical protein
MLAGGLELCGVRIPFLVAWTAKLAEVVISDLLKAPLADEVLLLPVGGEGSVSALNKAG